MKLSFRKQITDKLSSASDTVSRMDCLDLLCSGIDHRHSRFVEERLARVLTHDTDPVVRHEAAFTLGELYAKGDIQGAISIGMLCQAALNDRAVIVRHEAVETLGLYTAPKAVRTLRKCMRDPNGEVVSTAKISLARRLARQKSNHRDRRP